MVRVGDVGVTEVLVNVLEGIVVAGVTVHRIQNMAIPVVCTMAEWLRSVCVEHQVPVLQISKFLY